MKRFFAVSISVVLILVMMFNISAVACSNINCHYVSVGNYSNSTYIEEDIIIPYMDSDSGMDFLPPENWTRKELSEPRDYIDVKYVSEEDNMCMIFYGATDLWATMSDADKVGYSRSDFNSSAVTVSDMASFMGTTTDNVSVVTYNGIKYFKTEATTSSEVEGTVITVTMTILITLNNGWMHMFQFSGTSDHALYSDFESLLNSVHILYIPDITHSSIPNEVVYTSNPVQTPYKSSDEKMLDAVITILLFLTLFGFIVLVIREKNHKTDLQESSCQSDTVKIKSSFCRKCGERLGENSVSCHKCGTEVVVVSVVSNEEKNDL